MFRLFSSRQKRPKKPFWGNYSLFRVTHETCLTTIKFIQELYHKLVKLVLLKAQHFLQEAVRIVWLGPPQSCFLTQFFRVVPLDPTSTCPHVSDVD